jgi:hypothetical protein
MTGLDAILGGAARAINAAFPLMAVLSIVMPGLGPLSPAMTTFASMRSGDVLSDIDCMTDELRRRRAGWAHIQELSSAGGDRYFAVAKARLGAPAGSRKGGITFSANSRMLLWVYSAGMLPICIIATSTLKPMSCW